MWHILIGCCCWALDTSFIKTTLWWGVRWGSLTCRLLKEKKIHMEDDIDQNLYAKEQTKPINEKK